MQIFSQIIQTGFSYASGAMSIGSMLVFDLHLHNKWCWICFDSILTRLVMFPWKWRRSHTSRSRLPNKLTVGLKIVLLTRSYSHLTKLRGIYINTVQLKYFSFTLKWKLELLEVEYTFAKMSKCDWTYTLDTALCKIRIFSWVL